LKAYLVDTLAGFLALDENLNVIDKEFYPKDVTEAALKKFQLEKGIPPVELERIVKRLAERGYNEFVVEADYLKKALLQKDPSLKVVVEEETPAGEKVRENLDEMLVAQKAFKSVDEWYDYQQQLMLEMSKLRIQESVAKRDLHAVQAIRTVDDLDRIINILMARLREWFSLHFPELDKLVDDHRIYAKLVANLGHRSEFTEEKLKEIVRSAEKAKEIAKKAEESIGAEITEDDINSLKSLAKHILNLYELRDTLEKHTKSIVSLIAPNTSALIGPILTARLLSLAGGLEKLARLPASTIQVLGAEKALFRALRTGTKPPKHGVIFQHPLVHRSPRWQRGKIARALAGKIAIAARIDAFRGDYAGEELKRKLEERIKEIKTLYAERPARKRPEARPPKRRRRHKRGK